MRLPLAYFGDPVLRKKGVPVSDITDEIKELVQNMIETMFAEKGIGLAAPQVHRSLRIFVTNIPIKNDEGELIPGETKVYINPEMVEISKETIAYNEACLSIPGLRGEVIRPFRITIHAQDINGKEFTESLEGLNAICACHENDHINGVLFVDRIKGKPRQEMEPKLKEIKKEFYLKKTNSG